jgi:competence protein ComEA
VKPTQGSDSIRSKALQIATLVGVIAVTVIVTLWVSRDSDRAGVEILIPPPAPVTFQVTGEVVRPGVYSLDGEPRINDAVDAAGGFTAEADVELMNLALHVRDGAKVTVPGLDTQSGSDLETVETNDEFVGTASIDGTEPDTSTPDSTGKIDLNTATKEQLIAIPGVGEVRADSIIEWRTNNLIISASDLLAISGIGPSTVDSIRDHVIQP